jgi:hypothetical protein
MRRAGRGIAHVLQCRDQIYPFQILYVVLFALAYMIFMWSWYGATEEYVFFPSPLLAVPSSSSSSSSLWLTDSSSSSFLQLDLQPVVLGRQPPHPLLLWCRCTLSILTAPSLPPQTPHALTFISRLNLVVVFVIVIRVP